MPGFVLFEQDFARLSPETKKELFALFGMEGRFAENATADILEPAQPSAPTWDANGGTAYPLSLGEAKELIRGLSETSRKMLRVFCQNSDSEVGRATLEELLRASGHVDAEHLRKAIPGITRRLRTITRHPQAWIFDWRDEDWEWDAVKKTWARGAYHIPQPAIRVLCQAFGTEPL